MPINRKLRGAIEFEPVIKLVMALDRKKKTLPAGSYCPECGIRQEFKTSRDKGPFHFFQCSYVNYKIIEVEASGLGLTHIGI